MLENALKQPKFKYKACGPFSKIDKIIKRLKKKRNKRFKIYLPKRTR